MRQLLNKIREFDQRRPGFPGEHFVVATIGASLLKSAARRSGVGRMLTLLVAGALITRAMSGRDGVSRLSKLLTGARRPTLT